MGIILPRKFKSISEASAEALTFIRERKLGISRSLKTPWPKLNELCMGGVEWNVIWTVSGRSGCGKSAWVNQLETEVLEINDDPDICVLSFSLEMVAMRSVGRKISFYTGKSVSELYSVGLTISDEIEEMAIKSVDRINNLDITYVETPVNVQDLFKTIMEFKELKAREGKRKILIIIDHILLLKMSSGEEGERRMISDLQRMMIFMKKDKSFDKTFIQISQMNRNILTPERRLPENQFPIDSDLRSADDIFFASDYVFVLHRPEKLQYREYGPQKWPTRGFVYNHILKNRDGEIKIIQLRENLKHNRLDESI